MMTKEQYKQLEDIIKEINKDWHPNYMDNNQLSYVSNLPVSKRLCFNTKELAEYYDKHFVEVYNNKYTPREKLVIYLKYRFKQLINRFMRILGV